MDISGGRDMGISMEDQASRQDTNGVRAHAGFAAGQGGEPIYTATMLGPMLAGAQARGISDALDLMDVGAVLMDATGMVLQSNHIAQGILGSGLFVTNRHLIGRDIDTTRALQAMIALALGGADRPPPVKIAEGESIWIAEARPLPGIHADSSQLLKVIVILRRQ